MMARRWLSDEEVQTLVSLCHRFGELFPVTFPNRNITRKIHAFIFDVPIFVQRWRTIGMLSEQEGESKHASVNAELRNLACVRNHAEKIRLVLEREELRSTVDKTLMQKKSRLCSRCPGRVFLRSGIDKNSHCKICEPNFFV